MKTVKIIAFILVIIGALNWGLVGALSFDVVAKIFGPGTIARIIYIIVGIAGLFLIFFPHLEKKK